MILITPVFQIVTKEPNVDQRNTGAVVVREIYSPDNILNRIGERGVGPNGCCDAAGARTVE